ncbi:hypothetical protein BU15DRAFT_78335 [Melanogaster broomeanus]|nr:hypothetical protein BU15DRAFT_78335 [Melanogaster broomeanus]
MAGSGQPVVHTAAHDLESLYYVLLGICVLFHAPYTPKSDQELEPCFDKYFNTYGPSLSKTITIQSDLGWHREICKHISPYFQPLIPLLEALRKIIIMPITGCATPDFEPSPDNRVMHLQVIQELEQALISLSDEHWKPHRDPREQLIDPTIEYSLRSLTRTAATDKPVEIPVVDSGDDQPRTQGRVGADPTSNDELMTTDAEVAPTPVLEGGHLVYPRFPRPSDIRIPSGPGFEHRSCASNHDDADYKDTPPRKRRRSTSRNVHSTGKNCHLHRRILPVKLRNKTTSCLTEESQKPAREEIIKWGKPAWLTGEGSSTRPLPKAPVYMHAPPVYIHAQTEPTPVHYVNSPESDSKGYSSLTPNPSSESD